MTSASELFYTGRSRIGRNPNLGFSPSPSPDQNLHHHFHHHHHNHPREEGCDPVLRISSHSPPNARHLCPSGLPNGVGYLDLPVLYPSLLSLH